MSISAALDTNEGSHLADKLHYPICKIHVTATERLLSTITMIKTDTAVVISGQIRFKCYLYIQ